MLQYLNDETDRERANNKRRHDALKALDTTWFSSSPMVYLDRRLVTALLTRIKMFNKIIDVQGSIVECGVHRGNGLMTWYHLSTIMESVAINRKIIGFDTFEGFPHTSSSDPGGFLSVDSTMLFWTI